MNRQQFRNILVVRTDRIGDVVLTLPVVSVLRQNFPSAKISMLVRCYTREIAEGCEGLAECMVYDEPGGMLKSFFAMLGELRSKRFDLAVVAYPRPRVALLLFLAGISSRIGTGYRWYSFLFNLRVFEHRKSAHKHEAEHNLSLLKRIGCHVPERVKPVLRVGQNERTSMSELCTGYRIGSNERIAVLHPGSGGSARDWKAENFSELGRGLRRAGFKVIVTGSAAERTLVERVAAGVGPRTPQLAGRLNLKELAALCERSAVCISNSTGPLHIAAAVGTPVVAFYPPLQAASPQRWGPLADRKVVFVPDPAQCPLCHGDDCRSTVCMDQIEPRAAAEAAMRIARKSPGSDSRSRHGGIRRGSSVRGGRIGRMRPARA